jgi:hypothetical protein
MSVTTATRNQTYPSSLTACCIRQATPPPPQQLGFISIFMLLQNYMVLQLAAQISR